AEPDGRAEGDQQVTQLPRGTLRVVPGVAEEEIATLRVFPRLHLGLAGEGLDRSPFSSRVRYGTATTKPSRSPAAGQPAAGRATSGRPTASAPGGPGRRSVVGRGAIVRPGSTRRAVCRSAGRAMAVDGCWAAGRDRLLAVAI